MAESTTGAVRVRSRPSAFGPSRQSFEIRNDSKKEVTVYLERCGSEYFRIPESCRKLAVKPGRSVLGQVEFAPPDHGMAMTLRATYRATIKVWVRAEKEGKKNTLVDIVDVTGTAPGFVSPVDLRCFDPSSSAEQHKSGRRPR